MRRALHDGGFVGIAAELRDGRRYESARAGVADLSANAPPPRAGSIRIGSVTKAFVATAILQLEAEGRLSLDDSVERWLPRLISGHGNDGRAITLRNLLQHTSGLANHSDVKDFDQTATAFARERHRHYDPAELVAIAMRRPPAFPPADADDPYPQWSYSNTNYIVAGMVIEAATGRDWRTQVTARVLRPLRLSGTYAPGDATRLPRPHARTYKRFPESRDTWTDTTVRNMSSAGAAAEMISTQRDLSRFLAALLAGDLLPPRQLARMQHTVPVRGDLAQLIPGARYGLSLMGQPLASGGRLWYLGGQVVGDTVVAQTADGHRGAVSRLARPAPPLPTGGGPSHRGLRVGCREYGVSQFGGGTSAARVDAIQAQLVNGIDHECLVALSASQELVHQDLFLVCGCVIAACRVNAGAHHGVVRGEPHGGRARDPQLCDSDGPECRPLQNQACPAAVLGSTDRNQLFDARPESIVVAEYGCDQFVHRQ